MERIELLNTLLERETQRRDAAIVEWREAAAQAQGAREQAESLVAYRADYRKRWQAQFAQRGAIEILHCYQGFVERLEHAIGAQQHVVEQAAGREAAALQRLKHREIKLATVKRLIERRVMAAAMREQRREQKTLDEAAQRLAWGRHAAAMAAAA